MFEQLSFDALLVFSGSDAASNNKNASLPEPSSDASSHIDKDFQDSHVWVNKYSPGRRATQYYRLSYNCNGKKKHKHIRGGNIHSLVAIRRADCLQAMIDSGASIPELLKVIAGFGS